MVTDWILVRRVAAELDADLRGARIADAGVLDDGRFALRVAARRRRAPETLAVDLFGSPPLVTWEDAELAVTGEPGWARAIAAGVRGMRIDGVRSRPGDRVLAFDLGTTSRFGVTAGATLILELIPRFGNALLIRDRLVVGAAKQFSPAENEQRSVTVGGPYRPPPLPDGPPGLPRALTGKLDAAAGAALIAQYTADRLALGPVHVERNPDGRLVNAHVVPLGTAGLIASTADRLLPLWAEARSGAVGRRTNDALERRRGVLAGRIAKRLAAADVELGRIDARRADVAGRDRLREAGDALHTYGQAIAAGATRFVVPVDVPWEIELDPELDAKANAARYFTRYRKATDALPHLERRRAVLAAKRDALDDLAFEVERVDAAGLAEVSVILGDLEGRASARTRSAPVRRPLRLERPSGARIYVGRSPGENVDVTFRIARPDDLWFHARGVPGSHVVLQAAPGAAPADDDLDAAADLAARHSRARAAARVEIDFTERKYVRRQRDAAPGLVWYTNARTRVGVPERAGG
jgi:predicted ribosome quality control (RQC) complex YloA/Tae2 family protein